MPTLVVESGPASGKRIEVTRTTVTTLGRAGTSTVPLDDASTSDRHAVIECIGGDFLLRDLGSTNGTTVNGTPINTHKLATGDRISIGASTMRWVADAEAPRPTMNDRLIGSVIGGYKILERLGKGGMGVVYKANQQSLDRVVALKVLSPKLAADPQFVKKFSDEAQAAGRLNHPNIVAVYDVGHDGTFHFYSMEFIERGSEQALLDRTPGPLDPDLTLAIITDAARGLVFAEKKNIVHRDIKPDNLMINAEGVVKIADLGLALDPGKGDDGDRILGTPHYISPEQAQGLSVDIRSDLYSLGATWFRMATGRTVFESSDIKEIVRRQIEEPAPPLRDVHRDADGRVAAIVDRLLQKDPTARFQTAQALLEAVEKLGAPKSSPALRVAAILAVLGAAGAAWWVATQKAPAPTPQPGPVIIREGETAEEKAAREKAEAERRDRESAAKTAFVAAQAADNEAAQSEHPNWTEVQALYNRVATEFQGTMSAELAATRSTALAEIIAKASEKEAASSRQAESRAAALRALLASAKEAAGPLVQRDRFGEAVAAVHTVKRTAKSAGESAEVDTEIESILKQAEARIQALLRHAAELEKAGETDKAAAELDAVAPYIAGSAPPPAASRLETMARSLFEEAAAIRKRVTQKREADYHADLQGAFEARRASGKLAANAFDPAKAEQLLKDALSSQRLGAGKAELEADLGLVQAVLRVRDRFVAHVKATPDMKIRLPSPQDRRKMQDWVVTGVSDTGLTAKRGTSESKFSFDAAGAAEAFDLYFYLGVDKTPDAIRDAVAYHVWSGRPEKGVELLAQLPDASEREKALPTLRREAEGWELWTRIRELLPKANANDDAATGAIKRAAERLLVELGDTRAALLNRRDPSPPPKTP